MLFKPFLGRARQPELIAPDALPAENHPAVKAVKAVRAALLGGAAPQLWQMSGQMGRNLLGPGTFWNLLEPQSLLRLIRGNSLLQKVTKTAKPL